MRLRAAIVLTIGMAILFTRGAIFAHHSFSGESGFRFRVAQVFRPAAEWPTRQD